MADEIDIANDRAQRDLELALAAARLHAPALVPGGNCYNCGEELVKDVLFCDADCRDDYEHRLARHAR